MDFVDSSIQIIFLNLRIKKGLQGNLINLILQFCLYQGVLALRAICDAEEKPILLCSCNDNSVRLYDLPS